MTPYLFEVYDPRSVYPEYDSLGLAGVYRESKMLSGQILDAWGKLAESAAAMDPTKRFDEEILCEYWDTVYHVVWVDGKGEPLYNEEHGLPVIPVVCQIVEGSMIHAKEEDRRHPLLYGAYKSGMWEQENLLMTVIYSNIRGIGGNTQFVHESNSDNALDVDWSILGGVTRLRPGEKFYPMERSVVDPSVQMGLQIAQSQVEKSTLYNSDPGPIARRHALV